MPVFNQIVTHLLTFWKQIAQILASCTIIFLAASLIKLLFLVKPAYQLDILSEVASNPKRNLQFLETVTVQYTLYDAMAETLGEILYPKVDLSDSPLASMIGFIALCCAIFFAGILFGILMKEGRKG